MHELKERDQPQQYGGVCVQQSILLMSMGTRYIMGDPNTTEKGVECFILPSPVTWDGEDFSVKLALNKFLKLLEDRVYFGVILKQIYPGELAIIINETNIIFLPSKRISCMTPYITKNKF